MKLGKSYIFLQHLNAFLYGTRVISLELLLARLTTFFYYYNRNKQGGAIESWRCDVHTEHCSPFTTYQDIDGVTSSSSLTQNTPSVIQSALHTQIVERHQDVLLSVMLNMHTRSLLYKPLEILLHCQYKGFSYPPPMNEPYEEDVPLFLSNLSLKVSPCKQDVIQAMQIQAEYASLKEDNTAFKSHLDKVFSISSSKVNDLNHAVKIEMMSYPERYTNLYSSNTGLDDLLVDMQIKSSSDVNAVCLALSGALKSVIVYLYPYSTKKFHVAVPPLIQDSDHLINRYPLFVHVCYDKGEIYFSCTESLPEKRDYSSGSDDEHLHENSLTKSSLKCSCGKGRKTTTASCTGSRCPCSKAGRACEEQCTCQLCDNNNGIKCWSDQKLRACRCGENSQTLEKKFCVSSSCSCRKFGLSCNDSPACFCLQCGNSAGARDVLKCPPRKRVITERQIVLQKSSGKLTDMSSETFFRRTGQKLVQSVWNDRECLLLMSLTQYLKEVEHHVSVKYMTGIFNSYSGTLSEIRSKSLHQILYKMRHVDSCRNVCNN
jgi:hypothetical protein